MSTKIFIGCVWAVGLLLLLMVLGSRHEESSIEIWMWTAGITGLCWLIAKMVRDRPYWPSLRPYPSLRMMWVLFSAISPSPVSVPSVHRTLTDLTVSPSRRP